METTLSTYIRPIIITGIGSSGTSIIAAMLHKLGVFMGYTFVPANDHSPNGYYEDVEFVFLNDRLIKCQCEIDEWYNILGSLIKRRLNLNRVWAIKDPQIANLAQLYAHLFPESLWIICNRDKADFEISCRKYGWQAEGTWEARTKLLDAYVIKRLPHVLQLDFDEIKQNFPKIVRKVVKFCQLTLTDKLQREAESVLIKDQSMPKKDTMPAHKGNSIESNRELGNIKSEIKDAKAPKAGSKSPKPMPTNQGK